MGSTSFVVREISFMCFEPNLRGVLVRVTEVIFLPKVNQPIFLLMLVFPDMASVPYNQAK